MSRKFETLGKKLVKQLFKRIEMVRHLQLALEMFDL